jgi:acyl-coenzyme A thioesterase PaaI-like protein
VRPGTLVEARARVIRKTRSIVFMYGEVTVAGSTVLTASAALKPLATPVTTTNPAD